MIRVVHPGSRIQGSKRHRIPDPDPQHSNTEDSTNFTMFVTGGIGMRTRQSEATEPVVVIARYLVTCTVPARHISSAQDLTWLI